MDFKNIFENWSLPILILDRDLNIAYCNKSYEDATHKTLSELEGQYVFEAFPETEERVALVKAKFLSALEGRTTSLDRMRFNLEQADGSVREHIWQATQEPYFDASGKVTHLIQRADDVTKIVKAELEREVIQEELDHRMKNIHTVVQAMARLTGRSAQSIEDYREGFLGRMQSMSRAHERFMRSGLMSVSLRRIIEDEIAGAAPDNASVVQLSGEDFQLSAAHSRSITMLIHELTTNAVKHGCFSCETGRLHIAWDVNDNVLVIDWMESGLTDISTPKTSGFGSKMLTMLPDIEVTRDFKAEGLHARINLSFSATDT